MQLCSPKMAESVNLFVEQSNERHKVRNEVFLAKAFSKN
jgi:hypothetical protein